MRDGEKVGWIDGAQIFDKEGRNVGYIEDENVFSRNGKRLGYVHDDYLHMENGDKMELDQLKEYIQGGQVPTLVRAAACILLGD